METFQDWILTGVNIILQGVLLVAVIAIISSISILNSNMSMQQATNAEMQDYTQYNQFNGKHVRPQDITTAIFQYRGMPAVKVTCDGASYIWSKNGSASEFTATDINKLVNQNVIYDADIEKDASGSVVAVIFRQCDHGTVCGGRE